MSNLEAIKPEGEQQQPRSWQEDIVVHNADYSRPDDKRLSHEGRAEECADYQPD
ncbi:hypothetical protein [Serratia liquefaciens]|uniref:hypothetical protein n=1 Tax=Serratia liquefaciens TaxID=614 RepID=UPI003906C680